MSSLSLWEKILVAASCVEAETGDSFTTEQIVLSAWQSYPADFGLPGYEKQYPCSNKVIANMVGRRGLVQSGFMFKLLPKVFRLTAKGRQYAKRLSNAGGPSNNVLAVKASTAKLREKTDKIMRNLLSSAAFFKRTSDDNVSISFADACDFFGIVPGALGDQVADAMRLVSYALDEADAARLDVDAIFLADGRWLRAADLHELKLTYRYVRDRFARQFALLVNREEPQEKRR